MQNNKLLIEVLTEELPAIPFIKELPNIKAKWEKILVDNFLQSDFEFNYTPRRLIITHENFKTTQDISYTEFFGPPLNIAYKDDEPTKAGLGFAKKCGLDDLSSISTTSKNGKEILYFKRKNVSKNASELLSDMINEFIKKLNFGKSMKWGSIKESFIRPIRNLVVVLGDELVDAELYGVKSSKTTYGNKINSIDSKMSFDTISEYFKKLENDGVITSQDKRKDIILKEISKIEKQNDINVDIDPELLQEIVCITEFPTPLIGSFDEEFLKLPVEVIVGSMKEHQKYFACYKDGKITNKFIVVSNANTNDFSYVVSGNEKVLRPRLSDGMFFYKNDLEKGLDNQGLKDVSFINGLGSLYDKCQREAKIADFLAKKLDFSSNDVDLVQEAVMLSKADLLTDMVYEFTSLQGVMGYYYAKYEGKDEKVCQSMKEQYYPLSENAELPSNIFTAVVSLSNKFDNILALFSIGMIPSGSKDPYALRRAVVGIIKISIEYKLDISLEDIVDNLSQNYKEFDKEKLKLFFNERLFSVYKDINPSIVRSVVQTKEKNLYNIDKKIIALNSIIQKYDFNKMSETFKRVANIVDENENYDINSIDKALFSCPEETNLLNAVEKIKETKYDSYEDNLDALFGLKDLLDEYFENVFVNDENIKIKTNRKNTIGVIFQEFSTIANISNITI